MILKINNSSSNDLFSDFDRLFENFLTPAVAGRRSEMGFRPQCDIEETDSHFLASFDLPGMKESDINIEVKDNTLYIAGERERKQEAKDDMYRVYERAYGKFYRAFSLPENVDKEAIEANYENGVLQIALPKTKKEEAKKINIGTTKDGFFKKLVSSKEKSH